LTFDAPDRIRFAISRLTADLQVINLEVDQRKAFLFLFDLL